MVPELFVPWLLVLRIVFQGSWALDILGQQGINSFFYIQHKEGLQILNIVEMFLFIFNIFYSFEIGDYNLLQNCRFVLSVLMYLKNYCISFKLILRQLFKPHIVSTILIWFLL